MTDERFLGFVDDFANELVSLVDRMTDERFLGFVDDFANEHAQYILPSAGGEHQLLDTHIHDQYKRLFESRAEAWLRERGHSLAAFVRAASDCSSLAADVAQELLAVSDFSAFVEMMGERRRALELEALDGPVPVGPRQPPAEGAAQLPSSVVVTIPEGIYEGQAILVDTHQGQYTVTVPAGYGPGMPMQVDLPAVGN